MGDVQSLFVSHSPSAPLTFAEALRAHTLTTGYTQTTLRMHSNTYINRLEFHSKTDSIAMITGEIYAPNRTRLSTRDLYPENWEEVVSILPKGKDNTFHLRFLADYWHHAATFVALCRNACYPNVTPPVMVIRRGDCALCMRPPRCNCKQQVASLDFPRWLMLCTVDLPQDLIRAVGYKMIGLICDLLG